MKGQMFYVKVDRVVKDMTIKDVQGMLILGELSQFEIKNEFKFRYEQKCNELSKASN